MQKFWIICLVFGMTISMSIAQESKDSINIVSDKIISKTMDPLRPAKAAFYSAVLPGLGQAYNKKYWKIPLVYGAIGTSLYFYLDSNKKYNAFRDAYKQRLEGYTDDKFSYLSDTSLITVQRYYQRNKSFSAMFMVAFYVLNIIDANVDAALLQFNVDENLSLKPQLYQNEQTAKTNLGLSLNYNF